MEQLKQSHHYIISATIALCTSSAGIDKLLSMLHQWADETLGSKFMDSRTCEAATDPHAIRKNRGRDHLVLGHLDEELLVYLLLEEDGVVYLLPTQADCIVQNDQDRINPIDDPLLHNSEYIKYRLDRLLLLALGPLFALALAAVLRS